MTSSHKANPSVVATAELGPWTRATTQWTAEHDQTGSAGVGTTWQIVPDKATLIADYTASLASIDSNYSGFGVTNFDGTPFPPNHQLAFSSPSTVSEDWHVINLRLEIPVRALVVVTSYTYEKYALDDWAQASAAPWVESVGADTLLRDTSRSRTSATSASVTGSDDRTAADILGRREEVAAESRGAGFATRPTIGMP